MDFKGEQINRYRFILLSHAQFLPFFKFVEIDVTVFFLLILLAFTLHIAISIVWRMKFVEWPPMFTATYHTTSYRYRSTPTTFDVTVHVYTCKGFDLCLSVWRIFSIFEIFYRLHEQWLPICLITYACIWEKPCMSIWCKSSENKTK